MPSTMKLDDTIRLNILEALLKKGSVGPNIKQLQKETGYHKATIKTSLDFLTKEGIITGYGPKIDIKKFGYKIEAITFLQLDLTKKNTLEKFLEQIKKDENTYMLAGLVGPGNFNVIARHIYQDIESYYKDTNKKYFETLQDIYNLIKNKETFYITEPTYKTNSRTESIIKALRKQKGLE